MVTALHALQGIVGAQIATPEAALSSKQRDISQFLDSAYWVAQLGRSSPVAQAVLHSEAGLGARAFLNAMPSGRTRMEPAAFITELRIRLGVHEALSDCWCPLCDGVLDRWAIMLACAWQVANAPCDTTPCVIRCAAGPIVLDFDPRKSAQTCCPEDTQASRRRPADNFSARPCRVSRCTAALEFAFTAPRRQETLALAARETSAAAAAYAGHKEAHLDTALVVTQNNKQTGAS